VESEVVMVDRKEKIIQEEKTLLEQTIASTLDKSIDRLDDITLQKLKRARANALMQTPKTSRKWISLSLAASIAILLIAPIAWHQQQNSATAEQDLDVIAQDIPLDAQEMDDMEMLMAMGDTDA
jgi:hypothetical protein